MEIPPIEGKPVRFPPGRVAIRLGEAHRMAYKSRYAAYGSYNEGLPVLRDRDFDGRRVLVTPAQLDALNRAFADVSNGSKTDGRTPFGAQEAAKQALSKRVQYLS